MPLELQNQRAQKSENTSLLYLCSLSLDLVLKSIVPWAGFVQTWSKVADGLSVVPRCVFTKQLMIHGYLSFK